MKGIRLLSEFAEGALLDMKQTIEGGYHKSDAGYRRGYLHGWVTAVAWMTSALENTNLPVESRLLRLNLWATKMDDKVQDFREQKAGQTLPPCPWDLYADLDDKKFEERPGRVD